MGFVGQRRAATMRWFFLIPGAWVTGVLTYLMALRIFFHESVSRGDLVFVLAWSLAAYAACLPVVYLPGLLALRWLMRGWRPVALFSLTGMAMGIVPVALITLAWSGSFRALLTSEAALFLCMFIVVGGVLGTGAAFGRTAR